MVKSPDIMKEPEHPGEFPGNHRHRLLAALLNCGALWAVALLSNPAALAATPPTVTNAPATSIQGTGATLNGQVLATGGATPTITIFYGTSDGGTNAYAWSQCVALGSQTGAFAQTLAGLSSNTTYYFTAEAVNGAGTAWGAPSQTITTATPPPSAMLTYHCDNTRQGVDTNEALLTLANVNTNAFELLFTNAVDGQIYAQPLVMTNVSIPGKGTHNVAIVVTENDSVYAWDADSNSGANATPLWHTNFTNPAAGVTTVPNGDVNSSDINPVIGITATPVIDPASGTLYVEAKTKEVSGSVTNYVHRLHALSLSTGMEQTGFNSPVVMAATNYPGMGNGGSDTDGTHVLWSGLREHCRFALTLLKGVVYIGYASHGDNTPYHGWLFAYNATNLAQLGVYNTTPNGTEGGLWDGGGGPTVDTNGTLYVQTGNGSFSTNNSILATNNFGMSVLKLTTTNGLALVDYFTPFNESALNAADQDLGSGAPIILPDSAGSAGHPHLLVAAGKSGEGHVTPGGKVYLIDRDNLGHFSSSSDNQIVQVLTNAIGGSYSTPVFWNNTLYYGAAKGDTLKAFSMSGGLLSTNPVLAPTVFSGGFGGTPVISAQGTNNGIIWLIQTSASPAVLHAYNATNITQELYNSAMLAARDTPGAPVKFSAPAVANGKVYVGTAAGLAVFGLVPVANTPSISPNGGVFFTNLVIVTLADTTPGSVTHYTVDGTLPTTNSPLYSAPFTVSTNTTVIATAFASGFNASAAACASFSLGLAPMFTGQTFSANGVFQLSFAGVSGQAYILQGSTDLVHWIMLSTNVAPANRFQILDPSATNYPYRFYRVIELP
jgi:Chitobiase/beta-hexosaminidase C-terminal domain